MTTTDPTPAGTARLTAAGLTPALARRLIRRESFTSRSLAVAIALGIVVLGAAYVGIEAVLETMGAAPLLVSVSAMATAVLGVTSAEESPVWMLPAAAGALLLGIVLIVLAVAPGSRRRHRLDSDAVALLVDDDVLAGAVSRRAAAAAGVARTQVRTSVRARRAEVSVRPTSGFPVSSSSVQQSGDELLAALAPRPALRIRVAVASEGVVGA